MKQLVKNHKCLSSNFDLKSFESELNKRIRNKKKEKAINKKYWSFQSWKKVKSK